MAAIFETDIYRVTRSGAGLVLLNKSTGEDVYLQPGEDADTFEDALTNIDNFAESDEHLTKLANQICSEYFNP